MGNTPGLCDALWGVAQLVEQRIVNALVAGSSPAAPGPAVPKKYFHVMPARAIALAATPGPFG